MRVIMALGLGVLLAGCGPAGEMARPSRAAPPIPVPGRVPAATVPGSVQGLNAQRLIAAFGPPRIDLQEGRGRKLQFLGTGCVLDAYLYAPPSGGEPVVTHVDTRRRDGSAIDQAACLATLGRQ